MAFTTASFSVQPSSNLRATALAIAYNLAHQMKDDDKVKTVEDMAVLVGKLASKLIKSGDMELYEAPPG